MVKFSGHKHFFNLFNIWELKMHVQCFQNINYKSTSIVPQIPFSDWLRYSLSILCYNVITQVILAFGLILSYGLLEVRRTVDINIRKFSLQSVF